MVYDYECEKCELRVSTVGHATSEQEKEKTGHGDNVECPNCGGTAWRCYNINIKGDSYAHPIISDSLAMNPNQIAEHRELFPSIKVTAAGQPVFEGFKQHDEYLEKTGFHKCTKKVDGRKKERIA
jgi:predicted RNA-binding Zn-ribbon protein involved in translation (DUF1610 family)